MAGDRATTNSVRTILKNLQDTSAILQVTTLIMEVAAQTLKNLPDTMKKPEESIASMLRKLEDTATSLKAITETTKTIVGGNIKTIDDTAREHQEK